MEDRTATMRERGLDALVLVCTNDREEYACCGDVDAEAVADAAKQWLRDRDLFWSRVAVSETGCLGMCSDDGAAIVVQPANDWYAELEPADVPEVLAETIGEEGEHLPETDVAAAAD